MAKNDKISILEERLNEIAKLRNLSDDSQEFKLWRRNTKIAIKNIFSDGDGTHVKEFDAIRYFSGVAWTGMPDDVDRKAYLRGLDSAEAMLKSMIEEIKEWGMEKDDVSSLDQITVTPNNKKIFIVHGHDEAAKQTVARFIEKLGLESIILHEQSNKGRTIIEKFEHYSEVGFAVVLMTPDDIGASVDDKNNLKPRARQNVILELGFFLGKLGRERVCALYKNVEMPSDYDGVLYLEMDDRGSWHLELAREIKAAGIDVDLNKII